MGAFYGTIHVLTGDREPVKRAVETIASETRKKFLIAPPIDGWVTVFPEGNGQDQGISEALAKSLPDLTLIHGLVHDDDLFAYWYFENGTLKDKYNSCPDYFDDKNAEPRGGNAQAFAVLLKDPKKVSKLQSLLDAEHMTFEGARMEEFAELLNLPNAATAYDYLQEGERDGIEQWKQFIHIPDLTAERTAKRVAKSQAKEELKRLVKDGILIVEKSGPSTGNRVIPSSPVWCIDPATSDVLLAWTGNPFGNSTLTPVLRVNSKTGQETATGLQVSSRVYSMAVDTSGKWLAVGCASGDWKLELWNLAEGKMMTEIPQNRAVDAACFSPNGDTLFSLSQGTITLVKIATPEKRESIQLSSGGSAMAPHPGGEFLAVEAQGMVAVVHLPTLTVVKTVWILDKPGPMRTLIEKHGARIAEDFQNKLAGHMSAEQMAKYKADSARHFLPKQNVRCVNFTPSGRNLICGTTAGVCFLNWEQILGAQDMTSVRPAGFIGAEPLTRDDGMPRNQLIYAVPWDAKRDRVLFSGLEGKIRFCNVRECRAGDLLSPPFRWPLWHLEITPDRSTLVATAVHLAVRGPKEPPKFQLWSYPALCQAAGLEY